MTFLVTYTFGTGLPGGAYFDSKPEANEGAARLEAQGFKIISVVEEPEEDEIEFVVTYERDGLRLREVTSGDRYSRQDRARSLRRIFRNVRVVELAAAAHLPTICD